MNVIGEDGMGTGCCLQGTRQQDNIGTEFLPVRAYPEEHIERGLLDLSGSPSGGLWRERCFFSCWLSVSAKLYRVWWVMLSLVTSSHVGTRVDVISYI